MNEPDRYELAVSMQVITELSNKVDRVVRKEGDRMVALAALGMSASALLQDVADTRKERLEILNQWVRTLRLSQKIREASR